MTRRTRTTRSHEYTWADWLMVLVGALFLLLWQGGG